MLPLEGEIQVAALRALSVSPVKQMLPYKLRMVMVITKTNPWQCIS